tara:strand:- start:4973 stop:5989 length:1017 start_codon:yes stop_codon:yes gene_type:complete
MNEKFTEFSLIDFLQSKFATSKKYNDIVLGNGDDAAVIDAGGEKCWVLSTDIQMEDVHFRLKTSTSEDIANKIMAVNMSDIAAMGAKPRFALLSLGLSSHNSMIDTFLKDFSEEMKSICNKMGIVLLGGNVSSTRGPMFVDLFMIGETERNKLVKRSGARIGDRILVTGELGTAAAGHFILSNPEIFVKKKERDFLINKQIRPEARVNAGNFVGKSEYANSMIDISDSLLGDLAHICNASKVGAVLDAKSIYISSELRNLGKQSAIDPLDFAFHGGEDYELLMTASKRDAEKIEEYFCHTLKLRLTDIGEIVSPDEGIKIETENGLHEAKIKRWDHLK